MRYLTIETSVFGVRVVFVVYKCNTNNGEAKISKIVLILEEIIYNVIRMEATLGMESKYISISDHKTNKNYI